VTSSSIPASGYWRVNGQNATYTTANKAPAEGVTAGGSLVGFGQNFTSATYFCYQIFLAFPIGALVSGTNIEDADIALPLTNNSLMASRTPTLWLNQHTWIDDPTEDDPDDMTPTVEDFRGPNQQSNTDTGLASYTMGTISDVPGYVTGVWTDVKLTDELQAAVDQGHKWFCCYLTQSRHKTGSAPTDSEIVQMYVPNLNFRPRLSVTYQLAVGSNETAFVSPRPSLAVTVKPQERPAFIPPRPALAVPTYTGPVTAGFTPPRPVFTATTVRRWGNDELYGVVSDDGRRIGQVV